MLSMGSFQVTLARRTQNSEANNYRFVRFHIAKDFIYDTQSLKVQRKLYSFKIHYGYLQQGITMHINIFGYLHISDSLSSENLSFKIRLSNSFGFAIVLLLLWEKHVIFLPEILWQGHVQNLLFHFWQL